jgi:hypothetical protein
MTDDRAFVRNAADPEQVRSARKAEADEVETARDDMLAVLSHPASRRFLWRLLDFCHLHEVIYPSDLAAFREGERNVGLYVLKQIEEAQPEALIEMMVARKAEKDKKLAAAEARQARRRATHEDDL